MEKTQQVLPEASVSFPNPSGPGQGLRGQDSGCSIASHPLTGGVFLPFRQGHCLVGISSPPGVGEARTPESKQEPPGDQRRAGSRQPGCGTVSDPPPHPAMQTSGITWNLGDKLLTPILRMTGKTASEPQKVKGKSLAIGGSAGN